MLGRKGNQRKPKTAWMSVLVRHLPGDQWITFANNSVKETIGSCIFLGGVSHGINEVLGLKLQKAKHQSSAIIGITLE